MVARVLFSSRPLRRVTSALHGPSGTRLSSTIVIGSVAPIARLIPRLAGNGPALSPPGPRVAEFRSCRALVRRCCARSRRRVAGHQVCAWRLVTKS
jgi:hypothetical protein